MPACTKFICALQTMETDFMSLTYDRLVESVSFCVIFHPTNQQKPVYTSRNSLFINATFKEKPVSGLPIVILVVF